MNPARVFMEARHEQERELDALNRKGELTPEEVARHRELRASIDDLQMRERRNRDT